MSARCLSLARRRSALSSSWINQDPLLVLRMAAVPERGGDEAIKEGSLQRQSNKYLNHFYTEAKMTDKVT